MRVLAVVAALLMAVSVELLPVLAISPNFGYIRFEGRPDETAEANLSPATGKLAGEISLFVLDFASDHHWL